MIINLRYHIVSLVAVFLALGIGILIGSAVLGNDTIAQSQQQVADRLEKHLNELRHENEVVRQQLAALQAENAVQRQFSKDALPFLVAGRLAGVNVALVETSPFATGQDLRPVLEMAGARVVSVTSIINGFAVEERKPELLAAAGWPDMGEKQLIRRLAEATGQAIMKGRTPLIDYLEQEDMLTITGEYGKPVNYVIVVGGGHDGDRTLLTQLDIPLLDVFAKNKISVCGVEETSVPFSYMKDYQRRCTATVDNIDTVAGQFALVAAIAGQPGNYGVKETAESLLPGFATEEDASR
ncbi:MAG: copper transporter [Bacillota bacterium]|nr:copper transporter [Bacillota bacterium]